MFSERAFEFVRSRSKLQIPSDSNQAADRKKGHRSDCGCSLSELFVWNGDAELCCRRRPTAERLSMGQTGNGKAHFVAPH
jgi:hypothetical protein